MTISMREGANNNATPGLFYTSGAALACLMMLTACAYDPPVVGDRRTSGYQTDLTVCRGIADKNANRQVRSSGLLFLTYPVSLPVKERAETRKCMVGKGYKLTSD
jgi:hypothetical protein